MMWDEGNEDGDQIRYNLDSGQGGCGEREIELWNVTRMLNESSDEASLFNLEGIQD